ncbi:MAG: UDP-N-acetylmuramoyl-L-alanyl-D-glutamate--2,6-diaminopimelate ligase, partial [Candidatus Kapabacteria bacterium]|nr:UDP-N-acetylmuramoyl-L-alanyl-D-glutamate--2,6-diaminopimelate ligase [Candidatus Kapabacteria bacterium]
ARRGANADGHSFIAAAIESGAGMIICEECDAEIFENRTCAVVLVDDSAVALAELSHAFFGFPSRSMTVVGITGTNGKTTCTFLLKQLLESSGNKVGLIGTTGNYIGAEMQSATHTTPEAHELCALLQRMLEAGCSHVVMEVSSHALVLKRVHGMRFAGAMFTNLTPDHLDFHGTMEDYAQAKRILFRMLGSAAFAVVNNDSPYSVTMLDGCAARAVTVGRNPEASVRIHDEVTGTVSSSFVMNDIAVTMPLLGSFNIENAAMCIAAALECGVEHDSVPPVMQRVYAAPGRMMTIPLPHSAVAIIDYAHTPDALQKALMACKEMLAGTHAQLHCVFGCGGNRDSLKRPLMGSIAEQLADFVYITNDNPRYEDPSFIIKQIVGGMNDTEALTIIPDRREAIIHSLNKLQSGDIVLIAGKGHEEYQIVGSTKTRFSDTETVHDWLRERDTRRIV